MFHKKGHRPSNSDVTTDSTPPSSTTTNDISLSAPSAPPPPPLSTASTWTIPAGSNYVLWMLDEFPRVCLKSPATGKFIGRSKRRGRYKEKRLSGVHVPTSFLNSQSAPSEIFQIIQVGTCVHSFILVMLIGTLLITGFILLLFIYYFYTRRPIRRRHTSFRIGYAGCCSHRQEWILDRRSRFIKFRTVFILSVREPFIHTNLFSSSRLFYQSLLIFVMIENQTARNRQRIRYSLSSWMRTIRNSRSRVSTAPMSGSPARRKATKSATTLLQSNTL